MAHTHRHHHEVDEIILDTNALAQMGGVMPNEKEIVERIHRMVGDDCKLEILHYRLTPNPDEIATIVFSMDWMD